MNGCSSQKRRVGSTFDDQVSRRGRHVSSCPVRIRASTWFGKCFGEIFKRSVIRVRKFWQFFTFLNNYKYAFSDNEHVRVLKRLRLNVTLVTKRYVTKRPVQNNIHSVCITRAACDYVRFKRYRFVIQVKEKNHISTYKRYNI